MGDEGKKEIHKRIVTNLICTLLGILFVFLAVPKLIIFFLPLIVAWIIASIANPMVRFLEDKIKIMRKHGSAFVIIFIIFMIGLVIYLITYVVIGQISSMIQEFPELYRQVMGKLQDSLQELHKNISFIPQNIEDILGKNNEKLTQYMLGFFDSLQNKSSINKIGSFANSVIDTFVLVILTLMLSYFFVAQRETVEKFFEKCIPAGIKTFWNTALDTCLRALAGYLKACFKIMIVIFVILLIIFGGILKIKYAVLVALITSFLDFLPFLGTGIIITPWAIYCVLTGDYVVAIILVVAYVVCLVVHRLLEPKLIGDSVGMSPFATLISMFIGYRLIGMLGLIIGIPVGMIVMAFYEQGVFDKQIQGIKILVHDINEYRKF